MPYLGIFNTFFRERLTLFELGCPFRHFFASSTDSLFINSWEGISELGPWRHKEAHPQCVLFAPDPVTTARLETHNVYPNIGAHGARAGMRRNRWDRLEEQLFKRAEFDRSGKGTKHRRIMRMDEMRGEWIYKGSEASRYKMPVLGQVERGASIDLTWGRFWDKWSVERG
ncbi:hypothetical protein TNCV_4743851 [Trichonephila clavipes]|nr:hypothetical protein TNCV_4743851 [Trichonephila clavipes]